MSGKIFYKMIMTVLLVPVFCISGPKNLFGQDAAIRSYLALGDSYTVGTGVNRTKSWPMQLTDLLQASGVPVRTAVVAQNGWTTGDLAAAMEQLNLSPGYDLVTLMIGVNNEFRGLNSNAYGYEFEILLKWAILLAEGDAGRVIVVSIPDWGVSPFGAGRDQKAIAANIDLYNQINRTLAQRYGTGYVDVTAVVRAAGAAQDMYASDGLHPSRAMHTRWAETVLPEAQAALDKDE